MSLSRFCRFLPGVLLLSLPVVSLYGAATSALPAAARGTDPWGASYVVTVNGIPKIIPLAPIPESGGFRYAGAGGLGGIWSTQVSVKVTLDADNEYVLSGYIEVRNLEPTPRAFTADFMLEVCPSFDGPTLVGGQTRMQFTATTGGGSMVVPPGGKGFDLRFDGVESAEAYAHPFFITASGAGVVTVNGNFGLPIPSLPAPPLTKTLSIGQAYTINGANTARLLLTKVGIRPDAGTDVVDCGAFETGCDITGDGMVNSLDLIALLGSWGACPGCPADLNGDGFVDSIDLAMLLLCWSGQ